jgi:tRNA pseudouridine13 synthase
MKYELKQRPEHFEVVERLGVDVRERGEYLILKVTKKDYNTEDAVQHLASTVGVQRKQFSYAGNKDKYAVTTQYVSVKNQDKKRFQNVSLQDIEVTPKGYADRPISLGVLEGNRFKIYAKGPSMNDVEDIHEFTNYFDSQRFSENNHVIGKLLVTDQYKEAAEILLEDQQHKRRILPHLKQRPNDYISAIRKLPDSLLKFYVHAYQSKIWNACVQRIKDQRIETFPLIGFGTKLTKEQKLFARPILRSEGVKPRTFIVRSIPDISAEGTQRNVKEPIKDLEIEGGDAGVWLSFTLGRGSYATMAVKHLLGEGRPPVLD